MTFKGILTAPENQNIIKLLRKHLFPIYPQIIGIQTLAEALEFTLSQPGVFQALKDGPAGKMI